MHSWLVFLPNRKSAVTLDLPPLACYDRLEDAREIVIEIVDPWWVAAPPNRRGRDRLVGSKRETGMMLRSFPCRPPVAVDPGRDPPVLVARNDCDGIDDKKKRNEPIASFKKN